MKIPTNKVVKDEKLYIRGRREKLFAATNIIIDDEKMLYIENNDKNIKRHITPVKEFTDEYYTRREREILEKIKDRTVS